MTEIAMVAVALAAWVLLIRIPALVCAIAPGGHPAYTAALRAIPPDLGDVWIGYVSRATCTRCGAVCDHCLMDLAPRSAPQIPAAQSPAPPPSGSLRSEAFHGPTASRKAERSEASDPMAL